MTTEKTALERIDHFLKESYRIDIEDRATIEMLEKLVTDELAQEQAKTHKDFLMEAFEKCGIKSMDFDGPNSVMLKVDDRQIFFYLDEKDNFDVVQICG